MLLFNASFTYCLRKTPLNRKTLIDSATFLATRAACSLAHEAAHTLLAKYLIGASSASLKLNGIINPAFRFTFKKNQTKMAHLAAIYAAGPLTELAVSSMILYLRKKLPDNIPGNNGIRWGAYSGIVTSLAHVLPFQLKVNGHEFSNDSEKILVCVKKKNLFKKS